MYGSVAFVIFYFVNKNKGVIFSIISEEKQNLILEVLEKRFNEIYSKYLNDIKRIENAKNEPVNAKLLQDILLKSKAENIDILTLIKQNIQVEEVRLW